MESITIKPQVDPDVSCSFVLCLYTGFIYLIFLAETPIVQVNKNEENESDPPPLVEETFYANSLREEFQTQVQAGKSGDASYWAEFLGKADFSSFRAQAYSNPDGLAIRVNPVTGDKELMIAGTRSPLEWWQNLQETASSEFEGLERAAEWKGTYDKAGLAAEGAYGEAVDPMGAFIMNEAGNVLGTSTEIRDQFSRYIDTVIAREHVTVVYGHSRGAATASGLQSNVTIIGLDGAMEIAHPGSNFLNIRQPAGQGYGVDALLGGRYENSIYLKDRAFHDVTRSKGTKKRSKPEPTKSARTRVKKRKERSTFWTKAGKFFRVWDTVTGRVDDYKSPRSKRASKGSNSRKYLDFVPDLKDTYDPHSRRLSNKRLVKTRKGWIHTPSLKKRTRKSTVSKYRRKKKSRK